MTVAPFRVGSVCRVRRRKFNAAVRHGCHWAGELFLCWHRYECRRCASAARCSSSPAKVGSARPPWPPRCGQRAAELEQRALIIETASDGSLAQLFGHRKLEHARRSACRPTWTPCASTRASSSRNTSRACCASNGCRTAALQQHVQRADGCGAGGDRVPAAREDPRLGRAGLRSATARLRCRHRRRPGHRSRVEAAAHAARICRRWCPAGRSARRRAGCWPCWPITSARRCVLVSLPEEMAVRETIETQHALAGDLAVHVARPVINRVFPRHFTRRRGGAHRARWRSRRRHPFWPPPASPSPAAAKPSGTSRSCAARSGSRPVLAAPALRRASARRPTCGRSAALGRGDSHRPSGHEHNRVDRCASACRASKACCASGLIICVGCGGVGKTTDGGGVGAGRRRCTRRRTAVITVDPARRLKDALGLDDLSIEPQRVGRSTARRTSMPWRSTPNGPSTRSCNASRPARRRRSASWPTGLYQELSNELAGSAEYMAMEKLHELLHVHRYQTADRRHAAERARARPAGRAESADQPAGVARRELAASAGQLARPARLGGWRGWRLSTLLKALQRWTGLDLLQDLADFVSGFEHMIEGFTRRAEEVNRLLRAPTTAFVLVTTPEPHTIETTIGFHRELTDGGFPVAGIIANRVLAFPRCDDPDGATWPAGTNRCATSCCATTRELHELSRRDRRALRRLHAETQRAAARRRAGGHRGADVARGAGALRASCWYRESCSCSCSCSEDIDQSIRTRHEHEHDRTSSSFSCAASKRSSFMLRFTRLPCRCSIFTTQLVVVGARRQVEQVEHRLHVLDRRGPWSWRRAADHLGQSIGHARAPPENFLEHLPDGLLAAFIEPLQHVLLDPLRSWLACVFHYSEPTQEASTDGSLVDWCWNSSTVPWLTWPHEHAASTRAPMRMPGTFLGYFTGLRLLAPPDPMTLVRTCWSSTSATASCAGCSRTTTAIRRICGRSSDSSSASGRSRC